MMDIISVSLSTVFSLEPPNLLPLRKIILPCQEVADQPKKVRKASLKIPWKYQWMFQHGALWWLGCALPRKTQGTVFRETTGEQSDQSFKCSPEVSLGLVMTLTRNLHIAKWPRHNCDGGTMHAFPDNDIHGFYWECKYSWWIGSYKRASYHRWVIKVFIIMSPGPSFILTRLWRVWGQYFNSTTRLGHPTLWWFI